MSYLKVKKEIEEGRISSVYFFYGPETFLMEDLIQAIVRETVGSEHDPNVTTYSLQDVLLDDVIEDAETFSFFGGKKVIIIKDFFIPTSLKQDEKLDHDVRKLEAYLGRPTPETYLIFLSTAEKLDARKKITKTLQQSTTIVECTPFDDKMMDQWLDIQAQKNGFTFAPEAKEQLIARAGTQLLLLASEIEKIALYIGEGGVATSATISELTPRSLEQDVFALIDFAVRKRLDEALIIYHDLIKQKEEPLKLLALCARQLRIYYQVKELTRRSYSHKQIAGQLKLHPYVVKLAADQINRFDEKQLLSLIDEAAKTDYAIKTGKMEKVLAVELLLIKLAG